MSLIRISVENKYEILEILEWLSKIGARRVFVEEYRIGTESIRVELSHRVLYETGGRRLEMKTGDLIEMVKHADEFVVGENSIKYKYNESSNGMNVEYDRDIRYNMVNSERVQGNSKILVLFKLQEYRNRLQFNNQKVLIKYRKRERNLVIESSEMVRIKRTVGVLVLEDNVVDEVQIRLKSIRMLEEVRETRVFDGDVVVGLFERYLMISRGTSGKNVTCVVTYV